MIEVRENNLYTTGKLYDLGDDEIILLREMILIEDFTDYDYYIVEADDELTSITNSVYKHKVDDASKYWWVIADVNFINKPWDLSSLIGKSIYIPNIRELEHVLSKYQR